MKILKTLKSKKMKLLNFWKWPIEIFEDIRQWMVVRKAYKEPEVFDRFKKFKYPLRIDKLGRIYTVINIPAELLELEKKDMVWPWVLDQLREIDDLMIECQLSDLLYPEISPIEGDDIAAYLVVLTPSTESISISKFLMWLLNTTLFIFTIYVINRISIKASGSSLIDLFFSLF
jgi:hypothetical protein